MFLPYTTLVRYKQNKVGIKSNLVQQIGQILQTFLKFILEKLIQP